MSRDPLLIGVVGALIGGAAVWFLATNAVNSNNTDMMRMMGVHEQMEEMMGETNASSGSHMGMSSSMTDMTLSLSDKEGDAFDQAFIQAMIPHHQGAIEMAQLAQQQAKHQEIKDLADAIIEAQNKEINQMQTWLEAWGY
ncbi:hypothetical protein A3A66_01715 [Microgenomates group bacterium RIFCSPLOWO2_01_FULL_46_13]|nr:MAG: hypothetical protein A2783_00690 [Microgenomates group bacterium RIFCSPHIGHO2_01_FULL_45_11]OGV94706.1 MAG: hypothetical protein A3A66_01715 [Microgenomates group bacterium RIFCSPLOWO2_01_FULL_46_13]